MQRTDEQFWKKEAARKNWNGGGGNEKERQTPSSHFLQASRGQVWGDGHLIPLLTEGGWPAQPTKEQFNWKKRSCEKIGMVEGKQKGEANSLSLPSP